MDHAESAVLGHGDGETRFGDGVHRRREDRNVEPDVAREPRRYIDEVRMQIRLGRLQKHVIEGECERWSFDEPRGRERISALDFMNIDPADDRNLLAQNSFVAHLEIIKQGSMHRNCMPYLQSFAVP